MELLNVYPHTPILPWSETARDRQFRIILVAALLISFVIGAIVPFLPRPEIQQQELKQVSPRLAKLILQKKQQSKPKPVVTPKKTTKKKPKAKDKPKKKKTPKPQHNARKKAERSGLLAMQDELADLRESFDVAALQTYKPLKNQGKVRSQSEATSVLSANAGKSSGGINTKALSRATGGKALAARKAAAIDSQVGKVEDTRAKRPGGKASRSQEEIELIFQKNKGAIYALYNRALRKDPTLQGKVVLELTIAADGRVLRCKILSSELGAANLEKRLVARIKLFRFAAKDVDTVTVTYPIDFLPS